MVAKKLSPIWISWSIVVAPVATSLSVASIVLSEDVDVEDSECWVVVSEMLFDSLRGICWSNPPFTSFFGPLSHFLQ